LSGYVREILIITADIIKECKEELQISNLNMGQDTYNLDNEGKSEPELPIIHREESPRHKKNLTRSVATGIGLLVVIGLVAGYVFYRPVKTSSRPSSSQALLQGKTPVFGKTEEKNDLRTTVPPAPEKKAYEVFDRVEIGKAEDSRYYMVRGSEPKMFKEIVKKEEEISSSVPSEPVAKPADIATASGGHKAPEARVAAPKIESEKPKTTSAKTTSPKTKSVLVEKKTLHKKRAKLDVLGKKDLSPQKDRAIVPKVNKIAPAPPEKQTPPVMAKSFKTVQKPAAAVFVSEKNKPPVKTPAISESPTAGVAVVAKAPEEKKIVSHTEEKAVSESRKGIESQASTGTNFAPEDLQAHLNIFLSKYCRTYEKRQLGQFATFFTPDAMEKGKSFTSRLDQYRRTFERIDSMNYRIELKRYAIQKGTAAIRIEGIFHARARLVESKKWLENTGPMAMELVAHGDSFQVRRLEY